MIKSLNNAFIIPVIALAIVIFLYFLLLKKADNSSAFKKISLLILALAYTLNFVWEMAQMPLFENMLLNWETTLFCALASIADSIMVLLLYFGLSLVYKNTMWVSQPRFLQVVLLVITGGIGAVLAEKRHISLGNWAYNSYMPIVPVVNIGLSPLLQFMVMPAIIFYIASAIVSKKVKHIYL